MGYYDFSRKKKIVMFNFNSCVLYAQKRKRFIFNSEDIEVSAKILTTLIKLKSFDVCTICFCLEPEAGYSSYEKQLFYNGFLKVQKSWLSYYFTEIVFIVSNKKKSARENLKIYMKNYSCGNITLVISNLEDLKTHKTLNNDFVYLSILIQIVERGL